MCTIWNVKAPTNPFHHYLDNPDQISSDSKLEGLDWIEQCFTSPPTQYRLYGRRFLQVKRPNQQYQSTEGDATKEKAKNKELNTHIDIQ